MSILRTKEAMDTYHKYLRENISDKTCPLCIKIHIKEFDKWVIVVNDFPYDVIAETHHMLVPKRHAKNFEINNEELDELENLKKNYVYNNYDYILEITDRTKTLPNHHHIHLIIRKE